MRISYQDNISTKNDELWQSLSKAVAQRCFNRKTPVLESLADFHEEVLKQVIFCKFGKTLQILFQALCQFPC